MSDSFVLLSWCFTSAETIRLIRNWKGVRGWGVRMNSSFKRSDPQKTEETVSHRQNNTIKEVGTQPVRSNLCASLICVSEKQLCGTKPQRQCPKSNCWGTTQQQDNPSSYESPAPPPSSWARAGCKMTLCLLHYPREIKFIYSFIH